MVQLADMGVAYSVTQYLGRASFSTRRRGVSFKVRRVDDWSGVYVINVTVLSNHIQGERHPALNLSQNFGRYVRSLQPFFHGLVEQDLCGSGRKIVGVNHGGRVRILAFKESKEGKLRTTGTVRATQPCQKEKGIGVDCTAKPDLFHSNGAEFLWWGGGLTGDFCRLTGGVMLKSDAPSLENQ